MPPPGAVRPALCTLLLVACSIGRDLPDVEVREGYIAAGRGVELFYRALGSGGDTLVVLHGGPGFSMEYLIDDLTPLAERHTLIFYDQRGSGRSTIVTDPVGLDALRFVEDLEAVRTYFGQQRLTILAHSWGAGVAAEYAVIYPDRVERMIIVGGIPLQRAALEQAFARLEASRDSATRADLERRYAGRLADPGNADACRAYYELWFRPFFDDESDARRSRGDFCSGSPEALANKVNRIDRYTMASLGDWDWRPALRTLAARTLVIHGAADPMPLDAAREWAATLPDARLLVMDDAGHFPHVEEPNRFFDAVETFLAGEWPEDVEER